MSRNLCSYVYCQKFDCQIYQFLDSNGNPSHLSSDLSSSFYAHHDINEENVSLLPERFTTCHTTKYNFIRDALLTHFQRFIIHESTCMYDKPISSPSEKLLATCLRVHQSSFHVFSSNSVTLIERFFPVSILRQNDRDMRSHNRLFLNLFFPLHS